MKNSPNNPAEFYMDRPKHSPPPPGLAPCGSCKFWQLSEAFRAVITPAGVQRVSDLIKEGHNVPPAKIILLSQCAHSPMWSQTTDDHWCYQSFRAPDQPKGQSPWSLPDGLS